MKPLHAVGTHIRSANLAATDIKRTKIHAQRKFAQCSLPSTPISTPNKSKMSPLCLPKRAKTEDFLTFLCLRGSSVLPSHLDFFNYSSKDSASVSGGENSRPQTPASVNYKHHISSSRAQTRESSPLSTATSTSSNDDVTDVMSSFHVVRCLQTPNRKAARASASTPETARGLATMQQQNLVKKVAGKLGAKLGLIDSKTRMTHNSSPSKRNVKSRISQPKTTMRNGVHSNDLRTKKRSPGRPSLKQKLQDRVNHVKTSVHIVSESKKRSVVVRNSKSSVLRSLSKNSNNSYCNNNSAQSQKPFCKTQTHGKSLRTSVISQKSHSNSVLPVVPLKKLSENVPNRRKHRGRNKLQSSQIDKLKNKVRKQRNAQDNLSTTTEPHSRSRTRRDTGNPSSNRRQRGQYVLVPRSRTIEPQSRVQPSRFSKRLSLLAQRAAIDVENKVKSSGLKGSKTAQEESTVGPSSPTLLPSSAVPLPTVTSSGTPSLTQLTNSTNTSNHHLASSHHYSQSLNQVSPSIKAINSGISDKKKLNILKMMKLRMPTREQLKLARIIEKRRGKKNCVASVTPATDTTSKSLPQLSNENPKPKENVPSYEKRRGRPPKEGEPAQIVDIPIFYPSDEEFQDPLAYIESVKTQAEPFGMCKIVPPASWKLESCINEEMRFTSQVQYIHKMLNRWGPNIQQMECIKKHLSSVGIELTEPPLIGGIELDLARLYLSVKEYGGLQNVMDKKKWSKVADMVKIPKQAQDRTTKLYNAYCKYLLSYEMLSEEEKTKILHQVTDERLQQLQQRQNGMSRQHTEDTIDCCVAKGKTTSINAFQRVSRNVQSMWFRDDPTPEQVESDYWKVVEEASSHVVVQCGHINSGNQGTFFPCKKDSPYTKHGWNFNVLSQNPLSVLRHLGPIPGVTLPVLHIGMLFTTSCWSTSRHSLPYIHYLHTGADLIWYSIPKQLKQNLKAAIKELVPGHVWDDDGWFKEDFIMMNPELLVKKGVSVGRIVQKQHQFVVVFPFTYTASLNCGFSISESLPYATPDWLPLGQAIAQVLRKNCLWPEMFSLDSLLRHMVKTEPAVSEELLMQAIPFLIKAIEHELSLRKQLYDAGLKNSARMNAHEPLVSSFKRKRANDGSSENRCEVYKRICYFSMVVNEVDESLYCLDHALAHIQKKRNLKACKLYYRFSDENLEELLKIASNRLCMKETNNAITDPSPKRKSVKRPESKS
ncbi:protein Jumonji-like isoform X1 [Octopus vulgaris]|nr:protein Jumonji-like isoform X1 [Octopus vulgaris]